MGVGFGLSASLMGQRSRLCLELKCVLGVRLFADLAQLLGVLLRSHGTANREAVLTRLWRGGRY